MSKDNSIVLSVLSSEYYNKLMVNIMKDMKDKKICYVTLNKPTDALMSSFKKNNINTENIFFIDGITTSINKNKEYNNAILISSPSAFTEMSIAINQTLKTNVFDAVVLDSLSTLKLYNNENATVRFTSDVINKLRNNKSEGIITCVESDLKSPLIEKSSMYVDDVVNFRKQADDMKHKKTKSMTAGASFAFLLLASFAFINSSPLSPSSPQAVGLVVSEAPTTVSFFPFLIIALAATVLTTILIRKKHIAKALHPDNVNKPMNISDEGMLNNHFQNKILNWAKK